MTTHNKNPVLAEIDKHPGNIVIFREAAGHFMIAILVLQMLLLVKEKKKLHCNQIERNEC
jgi:hypothetical protein